MPVVTSAFSSSYSVWPAGTVLSPEIRGVTEREKSKPEIEREERRLKRRIREKLAEYQQLHAEVRRIERLVAEARND